jgi:hypothetical protein
MVIGPYQNQQAANQVYYDPAKKQYYRLESTNRFGLNTMYGMPGYGTGNRVYLGELPGTKKADMFGKNLGSAAPKVDINALPQIGRTQNQPYQRPGMPPTMPGQPNNFTPQFDMQALLQAIQARQAMAGQPRQGTLTPGAAVPGAPYGGDTGGLASLRAIAAGAPSASQ